MKEPNYCTTTAFLFHKQLPRFYFFLMKLKFKYFEAPVKAYHLSGVNGGAIVTCVISGSFHLPLHLCEYFKWNMGIMDQTAYFKPS